MWLKGLKELSKEPTEDKDGTNLPEEENELMGKGLEHTLALAGFRCGAGGGHWSSERWRENWSL